MKQDPSLYEKVERRLAELFKQDGKEPVLKHSRRTVFWLLKLVPDADEALKIAALAHDIERLSPPPPLELLVADSSQGWLDPEFLRRHSEKGADMAAELVRRLGAEPEVIKRVKFLVAGHEFAGTNDQNALKDADSVSFFENNIEEFLHLKVKNFGKDKVRKKFKWMYSRITLEKAKRIAAPWYEGALARLDMGGTKP